MTKFFTPGLIITNLIVSILSFIGSGYFFYNLGNSMTKVTNTSRMVFFLGVGDLIFTISNFSITWYQNDALCIFQASSKVLASVISLSMTNCLAYLSVKTTKGDRNLLRKNSFRCAIEMACIGGVMYTAVPFMGLGLSYGLTFEGCWVIGDGTGMKVVLNIFYNILPLLGSIVFVTACYVRSYRNLQDFSSFTDIDSYRLHWFPIAQMSAYLPSVIDIIYTQITGKESLVLSYIHIIVGHSTALINAIVYRSVTRSRDEMKKSLSSSVGEQENLTRSLVGESRIVLNM